MPKQTNLKSLLTIALERFFPRGKGEVSGYLWKSPPNPILARLTWFARSNRPPKKKVSEPVDTEIGKWSNRRVGKSVIPAPRQRQFSAANINTLLSNQQKTKTNPLTITSFVFIRLAIKRHTDTHKRLRCQAKCVRAKELIQGSKGLTNYLTRCYSGKTHNLPP